MANKQILITAALPYINNVPHMGHIVGSHLPADIFYRYCKLKGYDAIFVGGSDEHGTPSVVAAKELGVSPRAFVDKVHAVHKKIYEFLNISYTNYSRTSNPTHHECVREIFSRIEQRGFVHSEKSKMLFCEKDGMFLPDRFLIGTCPKCGYESANADQCESCSTVLVPTELVNPRCKLCGTSPVLKDTEHLYFELGKFSAQLKEWIETRKEVWRSYVYSDAQKWLEEGLRSRPITRDLEWGIKVPGDSCQDKVFYVWFDAPIGYISFTAELGKDVFEKYWKNPETKIYHFLGKDNIPFHTIFWPAVLMAHGDLNLPWNVVGYNYLNFEGKKFSKSKGIGVFCYNLLHSDINVDILRSYLTTVLPENRDTDFQWEEFKAITNSELIGKLGNLFNRTLSLIWKNFNGLLDYGELSDLNELDSHLIEVIKTTPAVLSADYERIALRDVYKKIMQYATEGNIYIDKSAPWKLIKENKLTEAKKVLYLTLNLCKSLAIVASPILPGSMQTLWSRQLNLKQDLLKESLWEQAEVIDIPKDHCIQEPFPLYQRIDDEGLEKIKKTLSKPHSLKDIVEND